MSDPREGSREIDEGLIISEAYDWCRSPTSPVLLASRGRSTEVMARDGELIDIIQTAFADRRMPDGRLIEPSVNLLYHVEAQRVDQYIRKNRDVVDRSNAALVAFNYLNESASMWILPFYMRSIIEKSQDDDFLIDLIIGALASGMPGASYTAQKDLGCRMRKLATDREAMAVCQFCRWLRMKADDPNLEATFAAAFRLWCIDSAASSATL